MSTCECEMEARNEQERRTLRLVLAINASMFIVELTLGFIAQSTGLVADSLDMLADASVYAISLHSVGKNPSWKVTAARFSGVAQILLACMAVADVLLRFFLGSEPVSVLMMGVGVTALVANVACLRLINRHREGGIHIRASLIFSTNDVIANLGVILSGLLVWAFGSRYPDLVIGLVIAVVVLRGGVRILREASEEKAARGHDSRGSSVP